MMRSLWTAASGMTTQQLNVDNISNNLANVNTSGFKKERLEFKSLLYQTMNRATLDPANNTGRPVNLQVGHGVRPAATMRMFTQGSMQSTENPLDFTIQGDGFFSVQLAEGQTVYSRDGAFKISTVEGVNTLVTSDGNPILNTDGDPITFSAEYNVEDITVDGEGRIFGLANGVTEDLGMQVSIVQFPNKQGLEAIGGNFYTVTPASGAPLSEAAGETTRKSGVIQGYLEMSNVQLASEMVNLIIAQRAYEVNSKAITTSDEMLQTANNLKR